MGWGGRQTKENGGNADGTEKGGRRREEKKGMGGAHGAWRADRSSSPKSKFGLGLKRIAEALLVPPSFVFFFFGRESKMLNL